MGAFAPLGSWSVYGFNLPRRRARTAAAGTAHNLHGVPAGCKEPARRTWYRLKLMDC